MENVKEELKELDEKAEQQRVEENQTNKEFITIKKVA